MEVLEKVSILAEFVRCGNDVDTWCYNSDGTLVFSNSPEQAFLSKTFELFGCKQTMLDYAKKHKRPLVLGTAVGIQWVAAFEKENNILKHIWVIGPVFYQDLNIHSIEDGLNYYNNPEMNMEWTIKFFEIVKTIPVLPNTVFSRYALMLHYSLTGEHLELSDLFNETEMPIIKDNQAVHRDRHKVWMAEQGLLQMVRTGDTNYTQALSKSMSLSAGVPVHGEDALRQSKTSLIVFASLVCRAAIEGGLSPDEAYSLSDNYIQTIESAKNMSELNAIPNGMYDDFIRRVHRVRERKKLSKQIQRCTDYINANLDKKINASDLASLVGYTEYYLTNKFKKETGLSVNDYIKVHKIDRAKTLLISSDLSINEIANNLGFSSRNYFSRIFLEVTGKTPLQYRESN